MSTGVTPGARLQAVRQQRLRPAFAAAGSGAAAGVFLKALCNRFITATGPDAPLEHVKPGQRRQLGFGTPSAERQAQTQAAPIRAALLERPEEVARLEQSSPLTIVLSWALFQARFGGDRSIIGRRIEVNWTPTTVLGVMPERFRLLLPPDANVPEELQAPGSCWTGGSNAGPETSSTFAWSGA